MKFGSVLEPGCSQANSKWTRVFSRVFTVPAAFFGLLVLGACDSSSLTSPSSSDVLSAEGLESVTASVTAGEEQLYLSDSGSREPNGDGTILFLVELDDGTLEANLTELVTMSAPDFDQVDAIAASTDGSVVYAVDKISSSLGVYDVMAGTFTDEGVIADLPAGTVLAATSPGGSLWVANQNNNNVYEIDTSTSPPQASLVGTMTGTSFLGADLVFDAAGNLFFWTNNDTPGARGLYSLDQGSLAASYLGPEPTEEVTWFVTGLAIRDAGAGDIVGSTNEDEVRIVDPNDGSTVATYAMMLDGSPYPYEFGDMTVGQLGEQDEGCTSTQGYWRTHNDTFRGAGGPPSDPTWDLLGPGAEQTEFFASGEVYYDVLWSPVAGNKALVLAHQYIAAELNVLSGAAMPANVQAAFDAATDWFMDHATGGSFPSFKGKSGSQLTQWAEILDSYNNGLEGVPHCDTIEEE